METLLLHCRPGFENEACAEISERAAVCEIAGFARAKPATAYAEFVCSQPGDAERLQRALRFAELIFIRQWAAGHWLALPEKQRVETILAGLDPERPFGTVWLEMPDTNDGKAMSGFCRKFERPLQQALKQAGLLQDGARARLLLTFLTSREVFIGVADAANSARWPSGIPRLKFPRSAPSRSTLKLEEAWHQFIPRDEWEARLAPAMRAVDLGAAPGGWTWQLVRRHMRVTAVDNGPMDAELMDSGLVEHLREDGFVYQPPRPVDWMVCDIVEKPARNLALLETWVVNGWCREAIVNLKLPMKRRHAEVSQLLKRLRATLAREQVRATVACRQLYHDREEVTCHVRRL